MEEISFERACKELGIKKEDAERIEKLIKFYQKHCSECSDPYVEKLVTYWNRGTTLSPDENKRIKMLEAFWEWSRMTDKLRFLEEWNQYNSIEK